MQYLLSQLTDYDVIRPGDSVICDLGADIPLMVFSRIAAMWNCELINFTLPPKYYDTILFEPIQK